jgi:hypothetical protein
MSAGGLSYSGLTNYGVATLPSVDSWGTNMNILRDPPKSIMTRRKDRVGETSAITETIDESGDRTAEVIQVYSRGVNPSVSVSYSNYGNNGGGGQSGSLTGLSQNFTRLSGATANTQSFLPYRIMAYDGNFRPPINRLKPQDLMPLSRQPRAWTSQFTSPGFADFSKKLRNPTEACNTREVITDKLNTSVRATEYKRIETPIEQPNETKYSVQDVMNISANSGKRTQDLTEQYVIDPSSGTIINNPLQANAVANKSTSQNFVNNNTFNTDNYIQDANSHLVNSNLSGNKQTNIEDIINIDTDKHIQNVHIINHTAHKTRDGDGTKYIHNDLEKTKVLPSYQATTNIGDSRIYKNVSHSNELELSRNVPSILYENIGKVQRTEDPNGKQKSIKETLNPGGYLVNNSSKPKTERISSIPTLRDNERNRISKFINNEVHNRF